MRLVRRYDRGSIISGVVVCKRYLWASNLDLVLVVWILYYFDCRFCWGLPPSGRSTGVMFDGSFEACSQIDSDPKAVTLSAFET